MANSWFLLAKLDQMLREEAFDREKSNLDTHRSFKRKQIP